VTLWLRRARRRPRPTAAVSRPTARQWTRCRRRVSPRLRATRPRTGRRPRDTRSVARLSLHWTADSPTSSTFRRTSSSLTDWLIDGWIAEVSAAAAHETKPKICAARARWGCGHTVSFHSIFATQPRAIHSFSESCALTRRQSTCCSVAHSRH